MRDSVSLKLNENPLGDQIAWTKQKALEAKQHRELKAAETPVQLFLPGMEEFLRAMPNHIARSSLFSPVARGPKKIHAGSVLVSRGDAVIKFWGEQLDEAQADVWMQAIYEASGAALGESVVISRASFLRGIGRDNGKSQYEWLHRTMQALSFAMLVIEVKQAGKQKLAIGQVRALHLVDGFDFDPATDTYSLRIDPRWKQMFSNREFALIDWGKRLQFGRGQDMAKALQRLIAASSDSVQRHGLDWLKAKLGYCSPIRKFRESLLVAMRELERLELIAGGRIEMSKRGTEQAVWIKLDSSA